MRERLPRPTYLSFLFSFLLWLLEQKMSAEAWWEQVPFWAIFSAFLAFGLGAFVQDLFNKGSWIYKNIRWLNKSAELAAMRLVRSETPATHDSFIVRVKFIRKIKNGRITITVHPLEKSLPDIVIHDEKSIDIPKYGTKDIPVCHKRIPKPGEPPIHSLWGDKVGDTGLHEGEKPIVSRSRNLIEICIKNGGREQRLWFYLAFLESIDETMHIFSMDETTAKYMRWHAEDT